MIDKEWDDSIMAELAGLLARLEKARSGLKVYVFVSIADPNDEDSGAAAYGESSNDLSDAAAALFAMLLETAAGEIKRQFGLPEPSCQPPGMLQ